MRVAVVSSDVKVINQHFGKASRFLIFEIGDGKTELVEARENTPVCGSGENGHSDDSLVRTISLISDCQVVLCARIGGGAEEELRKNGILPLEAPYFIHDALEKLEYSCQRRR